MKTPTYPLSKFKMKKINFLIGRKTKLTLESKIIIQVKVNANIESINQTFRETHIDY